MTKATCSSKPSPSPSAPWRSCSRSTAAAKRPHQGYSSDELRQLIDRKQRPRQRRLPRHPQIRSVPRNRLDQLPRIPPLLEQLQRLPRMPRLQIRIPLVVEVMQRGQQRPRSHSACAIKRTLADVLSASRIGPFLHHRPPAAHEDPRSGEQSKEDRGADRPFDDDRVERGWNAAKPWRLDYPREDEQARNEAENRDARAKRDRQPRDRIEEVKTLQKIMVATTAETRGRSEQALLPPTRYGPTLRNCQALSELLVPNQSWDFPVGLCSPRSAVPCAWDRRRA